MGIGGSIFLIAIGAILAFGVTLSVGWLDLWVVGWVLMVAGAFMLILTLSLWYSRRNRASALTERQLIEEQRIIDEQRRRGTGIY